MSWIYKTDTIYVKDKSYKVDDYGNPIAGGQGTTVKCRVSYSASLQPIINDLGNEVVPKALISMDDIDACVINIGDLVVLDGAVSPMPILSKVAKRNLAGVIFYWELTV